MTYSGTSVYPGIYRAYCVSNVNPYTVSAYVAQVFGQIDIKITQWTGDKPTAGDSGYVSFEGGDASFPVWHSVFKGAQGPQGYQGNQGLTGPVGPTGSQGDFVAGPQGSTGTNGTNGTDGTDGVTGATGPQGYQGVGVPTGGAAGTVLVKNSATNYDTVWSPYTWTDYTPNLRAGGTLLSIGTGGFANISGRYVQIGKTVFGRVQIIIGNTGYTVGTGSNTYTLDLPVATSDTLYFPGAGSGYSASFGAGHLRISSSTTVLLYKDSGNNTWNVANGPIAAGTQITASFQYEAS